jgi:ribosomal protein S18 acetylase RimI-like enzyme
MIDPSSYPFLKLAPTHLRALEKFFVTLTHHRIDTHFHPHPFDPATAHAITHYTGKDFYGALFQDREIIGYGLLRGYDEGYTIPSLGIAIHPDYQGFGLGKILMQHLHRVAASLGSAQIRLKVYPQNHSALRLYKKLGYVFQDQENGQLIGYLTLPTSPCPAP